MKTIYFHEFIFQNSRETCSFKTEKTWRGNHAHFVSKELRKAIYTRSTFINRFLKNPDEINSKLYKQQRNKCVSIPRKSNIIFLTLQVTG